jgi:NitT/TauT family transport system substrate-binding protein
MRRITGCGVLVLLVLAAAGASAETLRVGWCARTVTSAAAPFAIANRMGWFANGATKVELVPLSGGSVDCIKFVGTGEVRYSLPSIEPLGTLRPQGLKAKLFYTAYQGNIYGIAVPAASPIKSLADLRGKKIGAASMGSGGAIMAKAVATIIGEPDLPVIAVGEGAQAAALLRGGQVDALALYDTQYAVIDSLGVTLRLIPNKDFDSFPGNGLVALDDTLAKNRAEAVALAQGYAKGEIFAIANPEAAVRILWGGFPQTKATGKDEATALRDDVSTLEARIANWKLEKSGVKRWGESAIDHYQAYLDFLVKWGQIKEPITAGELVTNDLVADINAFDAGAVAAAAKAYK